MEGAIMPNPTHERIEQIRKRLKNYECKNDVCMCYEDEIRAIREMRENAPSDIKFLLEALDTLLKTDKT